MDIKYSLLVVGSLIVFSYGSETTMGAPREPKRLDSIDQFEVKKCPKVTTLKNVDKTRLLGHWFAYATTPLQLPVYQRRCASYNVKNNPYFNTNILYTDYNHVTITYGCTFNDMTSLYDIKLRILTRTRTPLLFNLNKAIIFLETIGFPVHKLEFLKAEAFCFEWYQLNLEIKPRPGHYSAPINRFWDHFHLR